MLFCISRVPAITVAPLSVAKISPRAPPCGGALLYTYVDVAKTIRGFFVVSSTGVVSATSAFVGAGTTLPDETETLGAIVPVKELPVKERPVSPDETPLLTEVSALVDAPTPTALGAPERMGEPPVRLEPPVREFVFANGFRSALVFVFAAVFRAGFVFAAGFIAPLRSGDCVPPKSEPRMLFEPPKPVSPPRGFVVGATYWAQGFPLICEISDVWNVCVQPWAPVGGCGGCFWSSFLLCCMSLPTRSPKAFMSCSMPAAFPPL